MLDKIDKCFVFISSPIKTLFHLHHIHVFTRSLSLLSIMNNHPKWLPSQLSPNMLLENMRYPPRQTSHQTLHTPIIDSQTCRDETILTPKLSFLYSVSTTDCTFVLMIQIQFCQDLFPRIDFWDNKIWGWIMDVSMILLSKIRIRSDMLNLRSGRMDECPKAEY